MVMIIAIIIIMTTNYRDCPNIIINDTKTLQITHMTVTTKTIIIIQCNISEITVVLLFIATLIIVITMR